MVGTFIVSFIWHLHLAGNWHALFIASHFAFLIHRSRQSTMTMIPRLANIVWMLLLAFYGGPRLVVTAISEEWCLARGFDPSNLACDTCALLEESSTLRTLQNEHNTKVTGSSGGGDENIIDVSAECQACCQIHKVNPILRPGESLRGKYRYALLTYSEHSLDQFSEIKDFLERDLDNLLAFKGESRLKAVPSQNSMGNFMDNQNMLAMMMGGGGGFGFGGGPPKLMLFEKQKQGGWSEEDEIEAGEVIILRGWKREDVSDMLMTLLPNA